MTDVQTNDLDIDDTDQPDSAPDADKDWKAEARKWQERAKSQAVNAKANAAAARELAELRQQTMTDTEKAVAVARAEARTEALREGASRIVDAEIRAAIAGRSVDVDALLEGLDRNRFVTDDGEPDRKAIIRWVDRIAPDNGRVPPVPGGPRGASPQQQDMSSLIRRSAGRT